MKTVKYTREPEPKRKKKKKGKIDKFNILETDKQTVLI